MERLLIPAALFPPGPQLPAPNSSQAPAGPSPAQGRGSPHRPTFDVLPAQALNSEKEFQMLGFWYNLYQEVPLFLVTL